MSLIKAITKFYQRNQYFSKNIHTLCCSTLCLTDIAAVKFRKNQRLLIKSAIIKTHPLGEILLLAKNIPQISLNILVYNVRCMNFKVDAHL